VPRVLYCRACGRPQILADGQTEIAKCANCSERYFGTEPPLKRKPLVWTKNDERFMKVLRIKVD